MAKKAMIDKELKREALAAKGKYPKVRLHNRCKNEPNGIIHRNR